MPQHDTTASTFEQLWQQVLAEPVQRTQAGEDDAAVMTADNLVAWLEQIADACLADGLIGADAHSELGAANATYARILGTVPPAKLSPKLKSLGALED
jgi:hypothetical protein